MEIDKQKLVLDMFLENKNVLMLGVAGSGKSFCVKEMKELNPEVAVTSTTGISAYNIGGMTIHSFLGIGTGEKPIKEILRKIYFHVDCLERIKETKILVIDEISMMSASLFEKIDLILQAINKNKSFFGGIQLILTGDLLQLVPIFKKNEEDQRLIIESPVFLKNFTKNNTVILTKNYRQKNDTLYASILERLRFGEHTEKDTDILKSKIVKQASINKSIFLTSINSRANHINTEKLKSLKQPSKVFTAKFKTSGFCKETRKFLRTELESQFKQKNILTLELKKGARVMLLKNLDTDSGLVNGAIGTVNSLDDAVTISFDNGIVQRIEPVTWELDLSDNKCTASQIPLTLAYSITIHKSQSISLDTAIMDLADCFCEHQVYVALSRVRTLDGLKLASFNENKISINDKMKEFMKQTNEIE